MEPQEEIEDLKENVKDLVRHPVSSLIYAASVIPCVSRALYYAFKADRSSGKEEFLYSKKYLQAMDEGLTMVEKLGRKINSKRPKLKYIPELRREIREEYADIEDELEYENLYPYFKKR